MRLILFSETLALCKLNEHSSLCDWNGPGPLNVVISDPHGKTVICNESYSQGREKEFNDRSLWRCFQIDEIFGIDSIGIVSELSGLLASRSISVFVISSYETDFLLVQPRQVDEAVVAFSNAGHEVALPGR